MLFRNDSFRSTIADFSKDLGNSQHVISITPTYHPRLPDDVSYEPLGGPRPPPPSEPLVQAEPEDTTRGHPQSNQIGNQDEFR